MATTTIKKALLTAEDSHSSDVTTSGSKAFYLQEGATRTFTLELQHTAGTDADIGYRIKGITWDTDADTDTGGSTDAHDTVYTFDLGTFKTPNLLLDNESGTN